MGILLLYFGDFRESSYIVKNITAKGIACEHFYKQAVISKTQNIKRNMVSYKELC